MCRYNGGEGFVPGAMFKKFDKRQGTVYVKKVRMLVIIIKTFDVLHMSRRTKLMPSFLVYPKFRYKEILPTDVALKSCQHSSQTGEH